MIDIDLDVETPIVYPDGRIFDYNYETQRYEIRNTSETTIKNKEIEKC